MTKYTFGMRGKSWNILRYNPNNPKKKVRETYLERQKPTQPKFNLDTLKGKDVSHIFVCNILQSHQIIIPNHSLYNSVTKKQ